MQKDAGKPCYLCYLCYLCIVFASYPGFASSPGEDAKRQSIVDKHPSYLCYLSELRIFAWRRCVATEGCLSFPSDMMLFLYLYCDTLLCIALLRNAKQRKELLSRFLSIYCYHNCYQYIVITI